MEIQTRPHLFSGASETDNYGDVKYVGSLLLALPGPSPSSNQAAIILDNRFDKCKQYDRGVIGV